MPAGVGEVAAIELRAAGRTSRIRVGADLLAQPPAELLDELDGRTVFLISARPLLDLHAAALAALREAAGRWQVLEVPNGEAAKTPAVAEELWRRMLAAGGKRDSHVLALGGGSVGDLAGFVAATFLRGVSCTLLPSTLLAQVDAAIGGKTAVDLPEGKNSVGVFSHPRWVLCDVGLLRTLPEPELRSGLFEVVKMGAVCDRELLDRVEGSLDELLACRPRATAAVVAAAARAKAAVVEADPEEGDRRRILNFGHTLGHALEAALGYRGLRHGEAVGHGMLFALELATARGLPAGEARRLRRIIAGVGLPPLPPHPALEAGAVLEIIARDKKAREAGLAWIYPPRLGEAVIDTAVSEAEIEARLRAFLRS